MHDFTITYSYPDMLAASWFSLRKRWLWRGAFRYIAGLACVFFLMMQLIGDDHSLIGMITYALIGLVVGVLALGINTLYWQWCVPRAVRKSFRQMQLDGEKAHFQFDEDRIEISDPTTTIKLAFPRLVKWSENSKFVLLYRTDYQCHFVPKQQVDSATLDALKANLIKAGVPAF